MRHLSVWLAELVKLLRGGRLYPVSAQCPICRQSVRLHVDRAGRKHVLAHARALFERARFEVHYAADTKCFGSGKAVTFDPRPNEHHHFKLPDSLREIL